MALSSFHLRFLFVLSVFFCSVVSADEFSKFEPQLLLPGTYHGYEVSEGAESYQWYGLFKEGEEFILKPTRISVERVHDPIVDENPEMMTGKTVSNWFGKNPLFFVRGIPRLKAGSLKSCAENEGRFLPGKVEWFPLRTDEPELFTLLAVGESGESDWHSEVAITSYSLIAKRGEAKQTLFTAEYIDLDSGPPSVVWAGDLDRDGAPDFFLDTSNHYNEMKHTLYLSSFAKAGKLLEKIAEFQSVGC